MKYSGIAAGASFGFLVVAIVGSIVDPLELEPVPMGPSLPPPPTSTPKPTATPKPPDLSDCFNGWDGTHRKFTEKVKQNLNDPSSLEAIETRYGTRPLSTGLHAVTMDFTAKNAFGGRVRHQANGLFDPQTCEARVVSIE